MFLNLREIFGFKKTQNSKFWFKINATISKRKKKLNITVMSFFTQFSKSQYQNFHKSK